MTDLHVYQGSLGTLLASLVARTPGLAHAVLVSGEGIPLATSTGLPTTRAEQLASIGAGLLSIADGAGHVLAGGPPRQVMVEMAEGVLLTTPVAGQVCLTLLSEVGCDRERLGYEVAQFADNVAPLLRAALS